ncbi:MAG: putative DNA binding domain-containing protein [Caldilineaceae bacterium]|nr:putative DNA binding domain-containing protein [Caldilineaceae bacterium]
MIRRLQRTITDDELFHTLDAGPADRVAFLPARTSTRSLAETLVALANANGGMALVGVSAKGQVQKDLDITALREAVLEAGLLTDPPLVLPSAQVLESSRGTVLVVQVPSGLPHIYSLQGMYLTRTAGQNRPLTTPELRRLLLERGDAGFEAQPIAGAILADLDEQRILRYLDRVAFSPTEDIPQALLARGCVTFAQAAEVTASPTLTPAVLTPTAAGILLFGRNPQQFLRSAEIICVRYAGDSMGDEFVRQDLGGPLPDQIRQAEAFVSSNMRRGMKIRGMQREESTEYPPAVVREAIVNAIAHRDYSIRGEGIRLLIFNSRMEIYSPGRLPGHVTLENLKDERYSRNEAIVAILSDLGYIERLGYGIDRMIATMTDAGLPTPVFEETPAGFKVTLQSSGVELVSSHPTEQPWGHLFLNERQEAALAYVQQNGRITNSEFQSLAPDVSAETIRRDLADLVERNLLLRIGEKRATYYIFK